MKCIDDEIPFEVPESWEWCRGYSCFEPMISTKPTDEYFKYIDIESIDNKLHKIKEPKIIQSNIAPSRATRQLSTGDTLFSMVRPYLENIAFVDESNADCIASTGFYVCKPNIFLESKYCYHLMTSLYVITGLNHYMKGDNSPSINNDNILNWLYPIPPLNEQKRIVTAIEEYQNIIEELNFNKEKLQIAIKQTKSKILDLAIRGKLVPQDPNDEPASVLLERIKSQYSESNKKAQKTRDNSHYTFEIPESWEWLPLSEFIVIISGVSYNKTDVCDDGIRVIRGGNITEGEIQILQDDVFLPQKYSNDDNIIKNGDIVIVASTGSSQLIGKPGFALKDYKNTHIGAFLRIIRPKTNEIAEYLKLIFKTDFYRDYIRDLAKGTSINNIRNNYIEEFEIPFPPLNEQTRIIQRVDSISSYLDEIIQSIET